VKKAAEMEEKVLEARCKILGGEHPDTLLAMQTLSKWYRSLDRLEEAVALEVKLSQAEETMRKDPLYIK
jgi:Tetratricopeptide repeat